MNSLLALSRLAADRGDGLHPALAAFLERRARIDADPAVVGIDAMRQDGFTVAGPCPAGKISEFLPGNVVRFESKAAGAARQARRSSAG